MSDNHWRQGGSRDRYRLGGPGAGLDLNRHIDEETAAAFALGALDAAERDQVERHRRHCATCASLLDRDLATAGVLAYAAKPLDPSPMTKATLFARVAHAQRAAAEAALPAPVATPLPPALTIPASRQFAATNAVSVDTDRAARSAPAVVASTSRASRFAAYLSLPLLVALVAIGGWGWTQFSRVGDLSASVANLSEQVKAQDAMFSAGFASNGQPIALAPAAGSSAASGEVMIGPDARQGFVRMSVTDPNAVRSYQMWMMDRSGKLVQAAEVKVGEDGTGIAEFELDQPFDDYESVHIKAEPLELGSPEASADTLSGDLNSIGSTDTGTIIPGT